MLREGQILNDTYRLVQLVGEGGMGVVYEATHARLAGRYAIKVLTQRLAESPEGLAQLNREARITSLLAAPQHRPGDRSQHHARRHRVPGHGVPRGREPVATPGERGSSPRSPPVVGHHRPDRGGTVGRSRPRRRPPRSQTRQRLPGPCRGPADRAGQDPRLRRFEADREPEGVGDDLRHAAIHGARAGRGARAGHRRLDGSVRARRDRARDADGPQSLPGRQRRGEYSRAYRRTCRCPWVLARASMPCSTERSRSPARSGSARSRSSPRPFAAAALARRRAHPVEATVPPADSRSDDLERKERKRRSRRRWSVTLGAAATVIAAFLVAEGARSASSPLGVPGPPRCLRSSVQTIANARRCFPSLVGSPPAPQAEAPKRQPTAEPQVIVFTATEPPPPQPDDRGYTSR